MSPNGAQSAQGARANSNGGPPGVAVTLDDEALAALLTDFAKVSEAITVDFIVDKEAREAWEWAHDFHERRQQPPSPQALKDKFPGIETVTLTDLVEYTIEKLEDRRERVLRDARERTLALAVGTAVRDGKSHDAIVKAIEAYYASVATEVGAKTERFTRFVPDFDAKPVPPDYLLSRGTMPASRAVWLEASEADRPGPALRGPLRRRARGGVRRGLRLVSCSRGSCGGGR